MTTGTASLTERRAWKALEAHCIHFVKIERELSTVLGKKVDLVTDPFPLQLMDRDG